SNFRSEVFVQTNPDTGEQSYVIGFKGTSMTSAEDWTTNARLGLGMQTAYYDQATEIARQSSQAAPERVSFTGHSLGGGLASAASTVSGAPGRTFNATVLHPNTVDSYDTANVPVQAYYVEGDILSFMQDSTPARDSAWTDYAGRLLGVLGAFKGSVWAGAGATGGHAAARGGRLHLMASVIEALAAEAEMLRNQAAENGCP
nr:hypothetical protein [Paracoccaceae bacterium]